MRKLGLILGMVFVMAGVAFATASPTATYLLQRLQYVEQLTGVPQSFIAARMMTPEQVDSIWGIDTDSTAWRSRHNTFATGNVFSDTMWSKGSLTALGDTATDSIRVYGQMFSSNYTGSSKWVPVYVPGALKNPSLWFCGVRWYGEPTAGYCAGLQVSSILDTAAATGEHNGIEGKATSEVTTTGSAVLNGVYGKIHVGGTSKTNVLSYGVHSILDIASGNTLTDGANFYAEMSNSGTLTAGDAFRTGPGTWTYGLDLNGSTFTADIRLHNGATINNGASGTITTTATHIVDVGRLEVTGRVAATDSVIGVTGDFSGKITGGSGLAITGASTTTTLAIGGGSVLAKAVATGSGAHDSLLVIVGTDTFCVGKVRTYAK